MPLQHTTQPLLDEERPLIPRPANLSPTPSNVDIDLHPNVVEKRTALFGYSLMALSAFAQATRALLFHITETKFDFPPSTALFLSAAVITIFSGAYVSFGKILADIPLTRKMWLQLFVRGLCTAATLYLNNIALSKIPVGTALTIFSTTPAITSVFAAIFLRDGLTLVDIAILLVNLTGIVLVSQPNGPGSHPEALIGVLAAVGAAVSASTGFMLLKKLGVRVHFMLNMLSIGFGCALLSICVTTTEEFSLLWRNVPATLITLTGATVGFITQALVNRGIQICRPGPASVVRTFNVPISFFFGLVFLNERVSHVALLGVILVLSSVSYIGLSQFFRQRKTQQYEQTEAKQTSQLV